MFLSVVHLVGSTNREGYSSALQKTWDVEDLNLYQTPTKSSLSEMRQKVSSDFFKEVFQESLKRFQPVRKKLKGFYVYAVDGSDLDLPASAAVFKSGYRGFPFSKEMETHYPKMYVVKTLDVLNQIVVDFKYGERGIERQMARSAVETYERNSIAIYDRLHCGHPTFLAHKTAGNHFLVRCRDQGKVLPRFVQEFIASGKDEMETTWFEKLTHRGPREGIAVRIFRIKNPKTKKWSIFVTSLSKAQFKREELGRLYRKRWDVETSYRDVVTTLKMDQWHSKSINGILQEIYAMLWLVNSVKMQMNEFEEADDPEKISYRKSNFKLCFELVLRNMRKLVQRQADRLLDLLEFVIRRTKEKRSHFSRSYPRVVRSYGTGFNVANKVSRGSRGA